MNVVKSNIENDEGKSGNEKVQDAQEIATEEKPETEIPPPQPVINPSVIDDIFAKLESLELLFTKRLSYDAGKEKILEKLHAELQDYKSDLYAKLTRPIFYDIAVVLDDMRKMKINRDLEKQSEVDTFMESIAESLLYLLDKYEVLPFSSETGSKYDATKQRMIRIKGTDDNSLVGLIAESVSAGFLRKDQLIFPEKVVVYKLEEVK